MFDHLFVKKPSIIVDGERYLLDIPEWRLDNFKRGANLTTDEGILQNFLWNYDIHHTKYNPSGINQMPKKEVVCQLLADFIRRYESEQEKEMNEHIYNEIQEIIPDTPVAGKHDVLSEVRAYVKKTSYLEFERKLKDRILGQEKGIEQIAFFVYSYLKSLADLTRGEYPNRPHFILAAPSGCGKTETYRVLEQVLREIPHLSVSQVDVSSITEAGYKGPDPDVLFTDIRSKMGNDTRGIGIVFMDEFDKKLSPSLGEHGTDNNLAVQNQLLTIIEGSKYNGKRGCEIDTRYTLFIGLGSFSKARQERELVKDTIGFTGKTAEKETHYSPITREDILSTGASYELLGRFLGIVNYQPLQDAAIRRILDNIARDLSNTYHIRIPFSESGYQAFIRLANGEFGCRSLKNQVWNTVFPALRREMISGNERTAEYRIEDIDLCQKMDELFYKKEQEFLEEDGYLYD